MNKEEVFAIIEGLETKAELAKFGEEVLGLTFKVRDTIEEIKAKITSAANGDPIPETQDSEPLAEPKPEKAEEQPPKLGARMLKNKMNGRTFVWTKQLARLPHMVEV